MTKQDFDSESLNIHKPRMPDERLSGAITTRRSWVVGTVLLLIFSLGPLRFFGGVKVVWGQDLRPDEIVTVLPKDAIPAILSPSFEPGKDISWLKEKDVVVGVEIEGDSRAYPVATLSRHEIVNDTVGKIPIAVTW